MRAGGELPWIGELRRSSLQRQFAGPGAFPGCLARIGRPTSGTRRGLPRPLFRARRARRTARSGRALLHRQDAVQRDVPAAAADGIPGGEGRARAAPSAATSACLDAVEQPVAWFNCGYRIEDIVHHLAATASSIAHYEREMALRRARAALRALRGGAGGGNAAAARNARAAVRGCVPELPRESAAMRRRRAMRRSPSSSSDRSIGRHQHFAARTRAPPRRARSRCSRPARLPAAEPRAQNLNLTPAK